MGLLFKNNAETTLSSGINNSVTTVPVASAAVFPTPDANNVFFATIEEGNNIEVVKVTGISSNNLTVVRAQDNTSAAAFGAGAKVELRLTAKILETGTSSLTDLDGDTKIQTEESDDEDKIRFTTGGTERVIIDSTGIGIGTSSPSRQLTAFHATNATLDVKTSDANLLLNQSGHNSFLGNSSTSGYLQLFTNNGNSVVNMLANGKVIIGDTQSSAADDLLQIETPASGGGHGIQLRRNDSNTDQSIGRVMFSNNTDTDLATISAKTDGATDSGALLFATQVTGGASTERMRIDSNGNVGIGSTPVSTLRNDIHATEKGLQVGRAAMLFSDTGLTTDLQNNSHLNNSDQRVAMSGTLGGTLYGQYNGVHTWYTAAAVAAPNVQSMTARMSLDISGNLVVQQNITAYGSPSDIKLKEDIEVIDNALDKVKQLKGITYTLKSDGNRLTGLIAQDLEKVLPEAVYTSGTIANEKEGEESEEHLAIRYGNTVGLLVEAIKEQQEQIEALTAKVKELEGK